jgi:CHASE3 domain sensor protein
MKDSTLPRRGHSLPGFLGKGVEKFIVTAFVVLMLLLTALIYFSDRTADRFLETMIWVDETHDVIDTMKDIELNLREAESALRSYVITGSLAKREEYLRKSSQGLQSGLGKIYTMSSAHRALHGPLARIEALLKPRLELMRESQRRYESGLEEQDENHQKATVAMDNLEQAFQEFAAQARRLTGDRIAEREAEAGRLRKISLNSVFLGGLFGVFTLTMILLGLYSLRRTEEMMRSSLEEKISCSRRYTTGLRTTCRSYPAF